MLRLLQNLSVLTALAAAVYYRPARAAEDSQAAPACLAWSSEAAQHCPTVAEVEAAVRDILRRPALSPPRCEARVAGSIRPDGEGGWGVSLHFTTPTGESLGDRSLQLRDAPCTSLKDSLSLVIALTVEGIGNRVEAKALRLPGPPARPARTTSAGAPWPSTSLLVGGAVSSGLLPDLGFGAAIAIASRALGGLPLRVGTTFWLPDALETAAPGGRFWGWVGDLGFCPSLLQTRRLGLAACLDLVVGAIRGVGLGLDQIEVATRPFGAGELAAAVSVPISRRTSVYASVGLAIPWIRPRFTYVGSTDTSMLVHEPRAAIPVAGLGIQFGPDERRPEVGTP